MRRGSRPSGPRSVGAFLALATAAAVLQSSPVAAESLGGPTHLAAGACIRAAFEDPQDAPHLDGHTYSLDYDCDDRTYVASATTYDSWLTEELDYYELVLDTDGSTANGCYGGDYAVVAYPDGSGGLAANALRTPSCEVHTWTDRGDVLATRVAATDTIRMAFTADQVGSPSTSRWYQALGDLRDSGEDLLPNEGMRTLTVPGSPGLLPSPTSSGTAARTVFAYGPAADLGSTGTKALNAPLVGIAPTATGGGYWLLGGDGGIFSYGDAAFRGSTGGRRLNRPVVSIAGDPKGRGYWLVASDGGIFSFGVPFHGSTGGRRLNQPVVGMAATASGNGYWLVASDGGIFSFGDAGFAGSTGGSTLNQPIVGMAADPDGAGYWFVAADGGIFSFDASFHGSPVGRLAAGDRVVSMAANPTGGYWVTSAHGDVFAFGAAAQHGQATGWGRDIAAMAAHPTSGGYWLVASH